MFKLPTTRIFEVTRFSARRFAWPVQKAAAFNAAIPTAYYREERAAVSWSFLRTIRKRSAFDADD